MPPFIQRRHFLTQAGLGLALAPTLIPSLAHAVGNFPQPPPPPGKGAAKPTELPVIHASTEKSGGQPPPPLPPEKRVGFALVGLGHLSLEELLPAFGQARLSRCTALVSGDAAKAQRLASQYGVPSIYNYENFETLRDNKDVQVIYVVLPNSMHKEYVLRAANIGKHILCEKPMSVNARDAQTMTDACQRAKVKLMIAYRQQYETNNRLIREIIRKKTYGAVRIFEASNSQNEGPVNQWRLKKDLAGGGALPDIGLYCLNAVRFLTGEEPFEVSAFMHSSPGDARFKEVEESIVWQMRFPSGLLASLNSNYSSHDNKRYRFMAETGWFGMDPAFSYHGMKMETSHAEGAVEMRATPSAGEQNQFALMMDHMADCVLNDKAPHTPGEEGVQDHKIMDAIYESASSGGRPVKLQRIEKLDAFRNGVI